MIRTLASTVVAAAAVALTGAGLAAPSAGAPAPRAAGAPEQPRLSRVGTFDTPVYVTAPAGRRGLYVVEQPGRIRLVRNGKVARKPFLNLAKLVRFDGEQGLLSMAFSPDFATDRTFYVNYINNKGDTVVASFRTKRPGARRALPRSGRAIMRIQQPEANHNGGQLQFGPDGALYIGMGDGGGSGDPANLAQNLRSLHGKLLRIVPTPTAKRPFRVPASNPYVDRSGARREIYASGLRNPWRFSFDRRTGALVIADVGQGEYEEVDYLARGAARGANFGWRVFEGPARFASGSVPGAVFPVLAKRHDAGWCAITGGFVVRDPSVPALNGKYVYGDFCRSSIRSVVLSPGNARRDRATGLNVASLASFGEDGAGHVYAVSLDGPVYRIR